METVLSIFPSVSKIWQAFIDVSQSNWFEASLILARTQPDIAEGEFAQTISLRNMAHIHTGSLCSS